MINTEFEKIGNSSNKRTLFSVKKEKNQFYWAER